MMHPIGSDFVQKVWPLWNLWQMSYSIVNRHEKKKKVFHKKPILLLALNQAVFQLVWFLPNNKDASYYKLLQNCMNLKLIWIFCIIICVDWRYSVKAALDGGKPTWGWPQPLLKSSSHLLLCCTFTKFNIIELFIFCVITFWHFLYLSNFKPLLKRSSIFC